MTSIKEYFDTLMFNYIKTYSGLRGTFIAPKMYRAFLIVANN